MSFLMSSIYCLSILLPIVTIRYILAIIKLPVNPQILVNWIEFDFKYSPTILR